MVKKLNYLLILGSVIFFSCASKSSYPEAEHVRLEQVYVPVIQGQLTTVARINLDLSNEEQLTGLKITLDGDLNAEDLEVSLKQNEFGGKIVTGRYSSESKKWEFNGSETLKAGFQQLDIKLKLPADADLKSRFSLGVPFVALSGERFLPLSNPFIPYRVGKALRNAGDDGVAAFRIPGLATSTKGTLLAVYDVRHDDSSDLQGDIDVGLSRSVDGGQHWEPMKIIMDMGTWGDLPEAENGIGDPAILVDQETGTIWVIALWLHGKPGTAAWHSSEPGLSPEQTGQVMLTKSEDDGISWSEPVNITRPMKDPSWQLFFNGPGKGISMKDGTLVFAGQFKDENKIPHSALIYSQDKGLSWQVSNGAKPNTTEAQVIELNDGSLMLNMRDNRGGARSVAVTRDLGETWETHPTSRKSLIEPVCMASLYRFSDELLLFSNPAVPDDRYNLTLKASLDDGQSWPEDRHILLDEEKSWGYSCLSKVDEENVGILYESSQAHMTFQLIPIQDLLFSQKK
ncbi:sialidase family protein [Cyclobacterium jeungdonense]|uniref:exo-alpha-sialidase n=1 Tax=Cyclobacterium jeungdonense TaxID=708087 RepID=A0ABT8CCL5_9BACT|nr:sialidase family protein [Cyclobacterium jeungdonense]MDN3690550.1 sialidase family protein [Cyclobacterium jeungdonense]